MDKQTLYTINANNKVKIWTISVKGTKDLANIIINTGLENGKMTVFTSEINKGKNIGKANETTPLDQAISEAKSKYNKKLDAGYTKTKQQTKQACKGQDKQHESIYVVVSTPTRGSSK